jgi:predicted esterase
MSAFSKFQTIVFGLYGEGKYAEELELSRHNQPRFPEHEHRLRFWMAGMLTRLERPTEAIAILKEGLSKGLWWNPTQFRLDSDFAALLELPAFGEVLEQCQIAWEMARLESQPKLRVYPSGKPNSPLLMALHMKNSNIADSAIHWESATKLGCMVALPQSSQAFSMDGYCWDDMALAEREIVDVKNLLSTQNPYDSSNILFGGASQGGLVAVYLALKNPARGFIAVVPSFGSRTINTEWEPLLGAAVERGLRGVFLTGQQDPGLGNTHEVVNKMRAAGLEVWLEVIPDLGHDYSTDMEGKLKGALEFIFK